MDREIEAVFRDPHCPYGHFVRGSGTRVVLVPSLLRFAQERFGLEGEGLEKRADEFVGSVGGKRERMLNISPASLWRRITGGQTPGEDDLYELPPEFFDQ